MYVAEVAQSLKERLESWRWRLRRTWIKREEAESRDSPWLLRLSAERRGEEHRTRASEERPPVHY
jgi:hypothetical protein